MQVPGTRSPAKIESAEQRRERLAAELRANLMKRKARSRARTDDDETPSDDGSDPAVRT